MIADLPFHVVQRSVDRKPILRRPEDARWYLELLHEAAVAGDVELHGYCVMTNHVHLVITPRRIGALATTMQRVAHRYAQSFNVRYGRTGALWEGRYYAGALPADRQALACLAYVERNPLRAGLARDATGYPWSSARAHLAGTHDPLLAPYPPYEALGTSRAMRTEAYRRCFEALDEADVRRIREGTRLGHLVAADDSPERPSHGGRRPGSGRPRKSRGLTP